MQSDWYRLILNLFMRENNAERLEIRFALYLISPLISYRSEITGIGWADEPLSGNKPLKDKGRGLMKKLQTCLSVMISDKQEWLYCPYFLRFTLPILYSREFLPEKNKWSSHNLFCSRNGWCRCWLWGSAHAIPCYIVLSVRIRHS